MLWTEEQRAGQSPSGDLGLGCLHSKRERWDFGFRSPFWINRRAVLYNIPTVQIASILKAWPFFTKPYKVSLPFAHPLRKMKTAKETLSRGPKPCSRNRCGPARRSGVPSREAQIPIPQATGGPGVTRGCGGLASCVQSPEGPIWAQKTGVLQLMPVGRERRLHEPMAKGTELTGGGVQCPGTQGEGQSL